ncbi:unnamed protein product, partial [Didymodactylos carnosus]
SHNTTYELILLTNGTSIVEFGSSDLSYNNLRSYISIQAASGFLMPKFSSSDQSKTNRIDSYIVGDIICFESRLSSLTYDHNTKTTLEDDSNRKERWSGDDGMIIDRKYGIGQLLVDGERHLHYQIDGQVLTSERFNVHLPKQLRLLTIDNDFIQNSGQHIPVKNYSYPVILGSGQTNVHGSCHREKLEHAQSKDIFRPPFQCNLEFIDTNDKSSLTHSQYKVSSIFDVYPIFDIDLPGWSCKIQPILSSHYSYQLSTLENFLSLSVHSKEYNLKSNTIKIEFQPLFFIKPSSFITISDDHPLSHIRIYTTGKNEKYIQIRSSNPTLVHIKKNDTVPFIYNVELKTDERRTNEPVYIYLTNTLTGQEEKLEIKLHRRLIDYPFGRMLSSLLLCIIICLIAYSLVNFFNRTKNQQNSIIPKKLQQQSPIPRVFISSSNENENRLLQQNDIFDYGNTSFRNNDSFSPSKQQQPVVHLYSAQDIRSRQLQSPRTTTSSFTIGNSSNVAGDTTNYDHDYSSRLQRLYEQ